MRVKAGFGRYNITPPLGLPMAGYAQREGTARGVHDELTARALALEAEGASAALVAVDTCMMPIDLAERAARRVEERIGIPAESVVCAAVHTHSGPALNEPGPYRGLLPELMASAVELAWMGREPANVFYGTGVAAGLCVNRRVPDGPVDEEIALLSVENPEGGLLGLLFAFPMHGVVMGSNNLLLSADYMGAARRALERCMPGSTAIYVPAPSGEMNPLTPSVRQLLSERGAALYTADPLTGIYDRTDGTFQEAEQIGHLVAEAALEAFGNRRPVEGAGLDCRAWTVDLGEKEPVEVRLRAVRLGEALVLALPGEHFIDTGHKLRAMVREGGMLPLVLTHAGQLTYVPTPQAFAEGGYEVELARRRGIARDAQTRILDAVRRALLSS